MRHRDGMTLREILVVIAILAILGYVFLLPTVGPRQSRYPFKPAQIEMNNLSVAIQQYEIAYNKMPVSRETLQTGTSDFTFGTSGTSVASLGITNASGRQANNSEVMAALMDLTQFPNDQVTPNSNHVLNPQRTPFFAAKFAADTNSPGIGPDGVFRDPWGHPYIISIHLGEGTNCRDAFYSRATVSESGPDKAGLNGLFRPTSPPYATPSTRDAFEAKEKVMIWSLGPDGKADASQKADEGMNKDNIISW